MTSAGRIDLQGMYRPGSMVSTTPAGKNVPEHFGKCKIKKTLQGMYRPGSIVSNA